MPHKAHVRIPLSSIQSPSPHAVWNRYTISIQYGQKGPISHRNVRMSKRVSVYRSPIVCCQSFYSFHEDDASFRIARHGYDALFVFHLALAHCDITCSSSQVYVKLRKQCGMQHANEEKYQIIHNGEVVATSPIFVNNELRESEFCLPASPHSVYTLKLMDSSLCSLCPNS